MPELPDIQLYLHALERRVVGQELASVRLFTPFLLRTVEPPISAAAGRRVTGLERIGKRIVFALDEALFLVIHLMIAGRFRWVKPGAKPPGRIGLAALDFATGTLLLTEAGTTRRASLHVIEGRDGLAPFHRGGIEVATATTDAFTAALRRENHTLKRALTDPRILDGIGNAYSDEILHRARLSPLQLTSRLNEAEYQRLHQRRPRHPDRVDQPPAHRDRRRLSREGHRLSSGNGGARPLWSALPRLRLTGAADPVRRA